MAYTPKILAFAGSLRQDSFNKKLVKIAAKGAQAAGAEVSVIDLKDYPLPVFDEDVEKQGVPANARKLKDLFIAHHGFLVSCPEYNSSITGVLKNTIDWVSRPAANEPSLAGFTNKAGALMSASPGALGGLRGLVHVRAILSHLGVLLIPQQVAVSKANEAFNADGSLKDAKQQAAIEGLGSSVTALLRKLNA